MKIREAKKCAICGCWASVIKQDYEVYYCLCSNRARCGLTGPNRRKRDEAIDAWDSILFGAEDEKD